MQLHVEGEREAMKGSAEESDMVRVMREEKTFLHLVDEMGAD